MDSTQMWLPFLQQRLADEENEKSQYWNGHHISMREGGGGNRFLSSSFCMLSMLVLVIGKMLDGTESLFLPTKLSNPSYLNLEEMLAGYRLSVEREELVGQSLVSWRHKAAAQPEPGFWWVCLERGI